jgi:hypothetical protein
MWQAGNYDQIIKNKSLVNDNDIIVEVDGDDYLPDDKVFDRVCVYYSNPKVWMTYGQFKYDTGQLGFAEKVNFKELRTSRFTASHLRTWKPKLWKLIKQEDLLVNNEYPQGAGDLFFMFPMLEMCGPQHALFVHHVNYVYNFTNPIGESKGPRFQITESFVKIARSKIPYSKIESL